MKHFSYVIRKEEDVASCIERFRAEAPDTYRSLLINVYTTSVNHPFILKLTSRLDAAFPDAVLVGCATTDVIHNGSVNVNATAVSFSVFESSEIRLFAFDDSSSLVRDGKEFCARARRIKDLTAIGIIGTLHDLDIQPFLDQLSPIDESVVIFGGGANTLKNVPACVFTKDMVMDEGILAVCYSGPELHVHASLNFGWKPLGREFIITKMEGVHVVKEIDHRPALQIYEQYLGIRPDKHFHKDTLSFPVFVRRGNSYIARHPVGYGKDGSLLFIADLHEGEPLRLAYGDPREMIEDAKAGYVDMAEFRPEALAILSCYAHRMFLRGDVKFELAPSRGVAPSCGFYTYGEIFRFAGSVSVHNMMILTVGFREGPKPTAPLPVRGAVPTRLKDSLLLVERLVRFVGATTSELEHANMELDRMARTDRLTQISNRGETEAVLKQAIASAAANDLPLSVLMLDLDDFKHINDAFGHDIGDRVLTETSHVLRAHIRRGETVGRWGGEEFLLVLPNVHIEEAQRLAESIRQDIAALRILPAGRSFTASFGAACLLPGESFDVFYRRVDAALYKAKRTGKNCVCVSAPKKSKKK